MRKILVVAMRDYLATVHSKGFIVSLIMMPIFMVGGIVVQAIIKKLDDTSEKRFAIIDRTPDQKLFDELEKAVMIRNKTEIFDPETNKQIKPTFVLEKVEPSASTPQAMLRQRYDLSQDVLSGKYFGFLEIGADAYSVQSRTSLGPRNPGDILSTTVADKMPDPMRIRYQSKTPQSTGFSVWASVVINEKIQSKRWADINQPRETVQAILQPVPLAAKGLTKKNASTGEIEDAATEMQIVHFLLPFGLVFAMFLMVMVGATPLVGSVLEEKMGRIAEVLLGSVRPFELMLGKLLGIITISLTIAAVYMAGGYWSAMKYGFNDLLTPQILAWFLLFTLLAVVMYGSIFIAIGAAVTNNAEAQTLIMPVSLSAVIPMFMILYVIQEPNSLFSTLFSFFPPFTPMVMVARLAVPPGVPIWQPILGMLLVVLFTLGCVFAAGRIFRVGMLIHGQGAKPKELLRWIWQG